MNTLELITYVWSFLLTHILIFLLFWSYRKGRAYKQTLQAKRSQVLKNVSTETSVGAISTFKIPLISLTTDTRSTVADKLLGNNGQTVILIHNTPLDKTVWDPLILYTQEQYAAGKAIPTLISFDLCGSGTAWAHHAAGTVTNMGTFVQDTLAVYTQLVGFGPVTLVGYGFGAAIAAEFAKLYPQLVGKLVLAQLAANTNTDARTTEIDYLRALVAANPGLDYITFPTSFVTSQLCKWFQVARCNDAQDSENQGEQLGYIQAEQLFRQADAYWNLIADQILATVDWTVGWPQTRPPTIIIQATRDFYTQDSDYSRMPWAFVKSVNGKHGYSMLHPATIYATITEK